MQEANAMEEPGPLTLQLEYVESIKDIYNKGMVQKICNNKGSHKSQDIKTLRQEKTVMDKQEENTTEMVAQEQLDELMQNPNC